MYLYDSINHRQYDFNISKNLVKCIVTENEEFYDKRWKRAYHPIDELEEKELFEHRRLLVNTRNGAQCALNHQQAMHL